MTGSKAFTPTGLPAPRTASKVRDGGRHLGVCLLPEQSHGRGQVGGPDEDAVHAVDRGDLRRGIDSRR